MNSSSNKVIACFYGKWDQLFYSVFDINNFDIISQSHTGLISKEGGINGCQHFV